MNWDEYFIGQLIPIAARSPDSSSKFAAIIVDRNHTIVSTGYNGTPRRVEPAEPETLQIRPEKYLWFVHAETNAICNAALTGRSTEGGRMYVIRPPCVECAKQIIQAGVTSVIAAEMHPFYLDQDLREWTQNIPFAAWLLQEAGIGLKILT